jgi:CheY-like chemotaxis protein
MSNSSKSILVIEDEAVLREVYETILKIHGYTVLTASNGIKGLAELKEKKPDIVFLDLFMPVMDGREFLRNIDVKDYPDTKIVVYTNVSDDKTETEMLELGAYKLVLKSSMSPRDLVELVEEIARS